MRLRPWNCARACNLRQFPVRCKACGARIRAAFRAQKAVLEIRPPGGPAGWVDIRAPGLTRTPYQAKARVTVCIVSPTQARLLLGWSCARRTWCCPSAAGHTSPVRMQQLKQRRRRSATFLCVCVVSDIHAGSNGQKRLMMFSRKRKKCCLTHAGPL